MRTILLALLLAQSGWVLWLKTEGKGDAKPTWEIVDSTATQPACKRLEQAAADRALMLMNYDRTYQCLR